MSLDAKGSDARPLGPFSGSQSPGTASPTRSQLMVRTLKKPFEIKRLDPRPAKTDDLRAPLPSSSQDKRAAAKKVRITAAARSPEEEYLAVEKMLQMYQDPSKQARANPTLSKPEADKAAAKKNKKQLVMQMDSLDNLHGLGYKFKSAVDKHLDCSLAASRLELSEPDLNPPAAGASPERFTKYFTKPSEKKKRDRQMVKVEERIFCSDWDRATHLIDYEEQKIKRLLQADLKPLDDPARYTLFEALVHGEYYYSLEQLGGSLLEFGFKEKLSRELLQAKAMCLTLFDVANGTYSSLYCKPSVIQKSIFLDDVRCS